MTENCAVCTVMEDSKGSDDLSGNNDEIPKTEFKNAMNRTSLLKGNGMKQTLPPPPSPLMHDKSDSSRECVANDEIYPEGGLEAWLVVFGAWCGLLASLGLNNTLGTLQTYVATNQLSDYDEGTIGWIFSIFPAVALGCGVYIGPMFDKYEPRWLLVFGAVCLTGGLMATSVSTGEYPGASRDGYAAYFLTQLLTAYWHFILAFSILTGLGVALLFTPCVAAIGHYFYARRGFASGVGSTAAGIGGVAFPLILTQLFTQLAWNWSIRILAFINLAFLIIAITLVKKR